MDAPGRSVALPPACRASQPLRKDFLALRAHTRQTPFTLLQAAMRSPGWSGTIREQRRRIEKLLRESPSLRPFVAETLSEAYAEAREDTLEETGPPETDFPAECPFTPDEILSRDFLPER
jgi:hypothetical protein